ncbi:hypothetical protein D3C78_1946700 [compost metagenome]
MVVLPAPLGPSRPTISPRSTLMETLFTTLRDLYDFSRFSVMMAMGRVLGVKGLQGIIPDLPSKGPESALRPAA